MTPEDELMEDAPTSGFYVVGITASCERLAIFATEEQASEYIGTLPEHLDGAYFLDGPCVEVVL